MPDNMYDGKPCRNCQSTLKYVSSSACVPCSKVRALRWKHSNRELSRQSSARTKRRAREEGTYWEDPSKVKQARDKWKRANAGKVNAATAKRRASKLQATPSWVSTKDIEGFYIMAKRLSDCLGVPHHVDHIAPLNGKGVCGLHVPWNLQVIPAIQNLRKGNGGYG